MSVYQIKHPATETRRESIGSRPSYERK